MLCLRSVCVMFVFSLKYKVQSSGDVVPTIQTLGASSGTLTLTGNCPGCSTNCTDSGLCEGPCLTGYYGNSCNQTCPYNCDAQYGCNQTSGTCNICYNGYHGEYCSKTCTGLCLNGRCNQHTGHCYLCNRNHFGPSCKGMCSANCSRGCSSNDGTCNGCLNNTWGPLCNITCPTTHCSGCMQGTGLCLSCADGYSGMNCDHKCSRPNCQSCPVFIGQETCSVCKPGWYGEFCELPCYEHCKKSRCFKERGDCDCAKGWYGDACDKVCFLNCAYCTDNSTCNDCIVGFYGDDCEHTCPANCKSCSRDGTTCKDCLSVDNFGMSCECKVSACAEKDISTRNCGKCSNSSWFTSGHGCCPCSIHCDGHCDINNGTCSKGCEVGYYGHKCNRRCSSHCAVRSSAPIPNLTATCNSITGHCLSGGCEEDWTSPKCDVQCSVNFPHCRECSTFESPEYLYCKICNHGYHLSQQKCVPCNHCLNDSCNMNGECSEGCKETWYSVIGQYCDTPCSLNCVDRQCNDVGGTCSKGCKKGYHGNTCSNHCLTSCLNNTCEQGSGKCSYGCKHGFYGGLCFGNCPEYCVNKDCHENGTCVKCHSDEFGDHCSLSCRGCLDGTCNRDRGCSGCLQGWHGPFCNDKCSNNCFKCDQLTGECLQCDYRFTGLRCETNCSFNHSVCVNPLENNTNSLNGPCPSGLFGLNCEKNCSIYCKSDANINGIRSCDKFTGSCTYGCSDGYYGFQCYLQCGSCNTSLYVHDVPVCTRTGVCKDGCLIGYSGLRCVERCPTYCRDSLCDQSNASCSNGCQDGHFKVNCSSSCPVGCSGNKCDQKTGECTNGCKPGFEGHLCTVEVSPHVKANTKGPVIVGISAGCTAAVIIILVMGYCFYRRHKKRTDEESGNEYRLN